MFEFITMAVVKYLDAMGCQRFTGLVEIGGRLVSCLDVELAFALNPGRAHIPDPQILTFLGHSLGVSGDALHGEMPGDRL